MRSNADFSQVEDGLRMNMFRLRATEYERTSDGARFSSLIIHSETNSYMIYTLELYPCGCRILAAASPSLNGGAIPSSGR